MTDIIFVGNPGGGKSTLISSLSGVQCESGISFGSGLTQHLKFIDDPKRKGFRWADTPGLADIKEATAEQASAAITNALLDAKLNNREVKLIFVCREQACRLKGEDMFTINKVMTSIKMPNGQPPPPNTYTILFNQFPEKIFNGDQFQKKGGRQALEAILAEKSAEFQVPTIHIDYVFSEPSLDYENNKVFPRETIIRLEEIVIKNSPALGKFVKATKIDVRGMQKQIADITSKMTATFDKKFEEAQEKFEGKIKKIADESKKANDRAIAAEKRKKKALDKAEAAEKRFQVVKKKAEENSRKLKPTGQGFSSGNWQTVEGVNGLNKAQLCYNETSVLAGVWDNVVHGTIAGLANDYCMYVKIDDDLFDDDDDDDDDDYS
jgi:GTPase SAR1 family protein